MKLQPMTPELRASLIDSLLGRSGPLNGEETLSFGFAEGESLRVTTTRGATVADVLRRAHIEVTAYATNGETHLLILPASQYRGLSGCLIRPPMSDERRAAVTEQLRAAR